MKILTVFLFLLFSQQAPALEKLAMQEIAEGIYVHFGKHELPDTHNQGAIANIGFIVGDKCVAVIDSGGNPEQGQALKKAIAETTDKPVCYVINTHVHPDHIYGNAAFKQAGVEFIGHKNLARAMQERGSYYLDKSTEQLGIKLSAADIIPPTVNVDKALSLDLGKREILLTAHPTAHTDNDLSIYDKTTDTLWLSDLLFREHLPVIDGSINGWISEIEKLEKENYRYVIPGHGALVTDWPNAIQPEKNYLIVVRDEIRVMLKQGKFLEEAVKNVGMSEKNRWKLFDQFHRKNVTTAFAELEWED